MKLVILSGLSGSGKSVALHTLEDLGYYCIDNLPLFLLHDLVHGLGKAALTEPLTHTAVGIDARTSADQLRLLPELIRTAQEHGVECRVIFLETHPDTLMRRFSETRRRHPLTRGDRALSEAVALERELLAPIRACADLCLDTTLTNVHELRDQVRGWLVGSASPKASLVLQSFGFKHGVPQEVDFVFDVRCLPNPHWQAELKPLTGRDAPVIAFLKASAAVRQMSLDLQTFFRQWIPSFETDGRSYFTIAIGCTGGQHRSVYMTETLRRSFEADGHRVIVRHRELP